MRHHYRDIIDRLGTPLWFDEAGVPRYDPFGPHQGNDIYASQIALLEIACQSCGARFKVAMSWKNWAPLLPSSASLKEVIKAKTIHYGDPPNYNCCAAGATMNCDDLCVLEFWERNDYQEFQRFPEYEIELDEQP